MRRRLFSTGQGNLFVSRRFLRTRGCRGPKPSVWKLTTQGGLVGKNRGGYRWFGGCIAGRGSNRVGAEMAGASTLHSLLNTVAFSSSSPPSSSPFQSQRLAFCNSRRPTVLHARLPGRPHRVRAMTDDDEWGTERDKLGYSAPVAVGKKQEKDAGEEEGAACGADELKKRLREKLYGTDRGLKASSETRAEIVELITQLEALNPNPAPTEALSLLNGKWILAYTSFSDLLPLLALKKVPQLVKIEEISQTIDSEAFTVQNCVQFQGPLASTSLTTKAKFEVRSPKRVQIKFEEGIIGTPQLTDSITIPETIELLGQNIDLSPFSRVFTSVQDAASSVAKTISEQPPLKIPITSNNAQSWLLTTYLDNELRISRGDRSSVFVLVKEGCSILD